MWGQLAGAATGTLRAVVAAIQLDFTPTATLFGLTVRLETLALAGIILLVLILVAIGAGRAQKRVDCYAEEADEAATIARLPSTASPSPARLRRDDLLLIAFGAVPGAVVGGRIDYALTHLDYYLANQSAIFDPGQGGLGLTLAVVFGTLAAVAVARLLAAPIGRWLEVAAVPLLVGLGLGKIAGILGGSGQGAYSGASWATYYSQPGTWGSANAGYPAVPSQAIEGGLVLALAVSMLFVPFLLRLRLRRWASIARPGLAPRRDWVDLTGGRRFLTAIGLWALIRIAVAFTWRDAIVVGPFNVEQAILVLVAVFCIAGPEVPPILRWIRAGIASQYRAWRLRRAEFKAAQAAERARRAAEKAAAAAPAAESEASGLAAGTAASQQASAAAGVAEGAKAADSTPSVDSKLATAATQLTLDAVAPEDAGTPPVTRPVDGRMPAGPGARRKVQPGRD
jgi:prolipoprotein diacylglyceryltransferase